MCASHPVVVIGAGPVGLAAAAHLLERGREVVVLEAGDRIASAIAEWAHVRLFSPWRMLVDPAARRLLAPTGWTEPEPEGIPTGAELIARYLEPLAAALGDRIRLGARVDAVTRDGADRTRSTRRVDVPFAVRVGDEELLASAVVDASGTWRTPNPLGANGLDPIGIGAVRDRVISALPDVLGAERSRFAGRDTTVVGAGHSAANTLLALVALAAEEPGTRVRWVIRTGSASRITASDDDGLPARASLGARVAEHVAAGRIELVEAFRIGRVERTDAGVALIGVRNGAARRVETDLVVAATGFRPDLGMLREVRLDLDVVVEAPRALAPLIDPNLHSCGTVEPHGADVLAQPEPGFYLVGAKSYGRAPTFLLATGYEQVRSVVAALSGDLAAARRVELVLPETGVCSTDVAAAGCCSTETFVSLRSLSDRTELSRSRA